MEEQEDDNGKMRGLALMNEESNLAGETGELLCVRETL